MSLTEEDKIAFFKSFLSDQPFRSTEKLFNEQFVLVFKSLTVAQSTDVFEQVRKDQANNEALSDTSYVMSFTIYRLAQALESINGVPYCPEITKEKYTPIDNNDSYIRARAIQIKEWPVFKLSTAAESFKAFEDKIIELTKEVQTENFWPAVK